MDEKVKKYIWGEIRAPSSCLLFFAKKSKQELE